MGAEHSYKKPLSSWSYSLICKEMYHYAPNLSHQCKTEEKWAGSTDNVATLSVLTLTPLCLQVQAMSNHFGFYVWGSQDARGTFFIHPTHLFLDTILCSKYRLYTTIGSAKMKSHYRRTCNRRFWRDIRKSYRLNQAYYYAV